MAAVTLRNLRGFPAQFPRFACSISDGVFNIHDLHCQNAFTNSDLTRLTLSAEDDTFIFL